MPKVLMRPEAIAKSMHSKVLSWFSIRVNLAKLNALDSRTLMDIGLNRNSRDTFRTWGAAARSVGIMRNIAKVIVPKTKLMTSDVR
jgi:uncharacterized protein YjiS (DUF1127 family)